MGTLGFGLGGFKLNPSGGGSSIWRPPQWGPNGLQPIMLSTPANYTSSLPQYSAATGAPSGAVSAGSSAANYVFDAVLSLEHEQKLTRTKHPTQTGGDFSDHAYIEPATVTLFIGMSDAMDSYQSGMWVGNQSKSVSAYQTLLSLQAARVPLTLTTRLRVYQNMVIDSISAEESNKTFGSLRARVQFGQIFTASVAGAVSSGNSSSRPDATNQTNQGSITPAAPSATTATQFNSSEGAGGGSSAQIVTGSFASQSGPNFGTGPWSSVNTQSLNQPVNPQ